MKKKLFSIFLVAALMLTMSVTVFGMDHDDPYSYGIAATTTAR